MIENLKLINETLNLFEFALELLEHIYDSSKIKIENCEDAFYQLNSSTTF